MSLGMLRFAIALVFLYFIKLKLATAEKLCFQDIVCPPVGVRFNLPVKRLVQHKQYNTLY
jgi:hypothetical protein